MEENPLISICIPVFNGGPFIWRALESSINQTYKNIEVIVVDNVSSDDTALVVLRYAKKDARIKYFKNKETIGPYENFLESFKRASGEFSQLLAADDWLSRNHIEEGLDKFKSNPEAAAVFTKYISFYMAEDGRLTFDEVGTVEPGFYSREYYLKNIYRTYLGAFSIYALLRTKDLVEATSFTQKFFHNPPRNLRPEFQNLCKAGFGVDIMMFLRVIPRYKYFVFTDRSAYIKTEHSANYGKKAGSYISMNMATGILNNYGFFRACHEFLYEKDFKPYERGLRVATGVDAVNSILFFYIRKNFPRGYFSGLRVENFRVFFRDYSLFEKTLVVLGVVPDFIKRAFKFIVRKTKRDSKIAVTDDIFFKEGEFSLN